MKKIKQLIEEIRFMIWQSSQRTPVESATPLYKVVNKSLDPTFFGYMELGDIQLNDYLYFFKNTWDSFSFYYQFSIPTFFLKIHPIDYRGNTLRSDKKKISFIPIIHGIDNNGLSYIFSTYPWGEE